jgi:hypothetical protein
LIDPTNLGTYGKPLLENMEHGNFRFNEPLGVTNNYVVIICLMCVLQCRL